MSSDQPDIAEIDRVRQVGDPGRYFAPLRPSGGSAAARSILDVPCASIYRAAAFSAPSNTITAIPFDTKDYDNCGMWKPGALGSRLTCQVAGVYAVSGWAIWNAAITDGWRNLRLRTNGTIEWAHNYTWPGSCITLDIYMRPGDFVELAIDHNSATSPIAMYTATPLARYNGLTARLGSSLGGSR